MSFIERHLNISPDGGDGSMEILLLVALVANCRCGGVSSRDKIERHVRLLPKADISAFRFPARIMNCDQPDFV
jgi:hypothetical protein